MKLVSTVSHLLLLPFGCLYRRFDSRGIVIWNVPSIPPLLRHSCHWYLYFQPRHGYIHCQLSITSLVRIPSTTSLARIPSTTSLAHKPSSTSLVRMPSTSTYPLYWHEMFITYFVRVSAVQGVSFVAGLRTADRASSSIPLNQCNVPFYSKHSGDKYRTARSITIWTVRLLLCPWPR
jgi:hypothetical protein